MKRQKLLNLNGLGVKWGQALCEIELKSPASVTLDPMGHNSLWRAKSYLGTRDSKKFTLTSKLWKYKFRITKFYIGTHL